MISLKKLNILEHSQKLPKTVGDLGKLIVAKGFKKLPKVQKIAKSGHTARNAYPQFASPFSGLHLRTLSDENSRRQFFVLFQIV